MSLLDIRYSCYIWITQITGVYLLHAHKLERGILLPPVEDAALPHPGARTENICAHKKYLSCLLPDLAGSAGHLAVLNSPDPYSTPLLEPRLGPNIHLPFFLSKKRNIA